jgi:hypothetical protein
MEASERQKLTTKDMARVEGDKKESEHFNQDSRSSAEAEAALGVPTHLNRINGEALNPLLSTNEGDHFRSRWQNIQTSFVDEPRRAVEQADELVAEIMQRLAQSFSDQRSRLASEWEHSEKVSTEELRGALRSYRSFFNRLLSV